MIKVNDVLEFLNRLFPISTACDFDNVGLLVGDKNKDVTGILLCLDCDKTAVLKAKEMGANLIITHHPVIFEPLKSVCDDSVVFDLVKNGISVISMHTNLDIAPLGVTETLCAALKLQNVKDFESSDGFLIRSATVNSTMPCTLAKGFKELLGFNIRYNDTNKKLENVLVCSGSGGDFLYDAIEGGFDALICADVKHHIFIAAQNAGVCVFDVGHYASENIILPVLFDLLNKEFEGIKIAVHNLDFITSV